MSKKLKKNLYRILAGAAVYMIAVTVTAVLPSISGNAELILYLAAYFIIGGSVVRKAVRNIRNGRIFDENFLMMIATVGAFLIGEYPEAAAVMLFYQVGEWFQSYAVNQSRKSIADLMDIRPDYANVLRNGEVTQVSPEEVTVGELIEIKPGERIPLDGTICTGSSSLDTMALTGESMPKDVQAGDEVISGCVNLNGLLTVKVNKEYGQSTVSKILDLVENAGSKKAETEKFITKFATWYTPAVVLCAAVIAVIPSIITGDIVTWVYRALSFLVISCPCALVISIPLSFFGGLGGAGRQGILIKGSNYLEALADTGIVVMDKTGTLTKGRFAVTGIVPAGTEAGEPRMDKERLLEIAAYAESSSNHPISRSVVRAYAKPIQKERLQEVEEEAGYGVKAKVDGQMILAGNGAWLEKAGIAYQKASEAGTIVYLAVNSVYFGYLVVADEIKEDAGKAIADMKKSGVRKIVMLTGDREEIANKIAEQLEIEEVYAGLLPGDKVDKTEQLFRQKKDKEKLAFVGDGINDAPVLARADIGIAMGGLGSDAAIEAADVVIMTDEPSKIAVAMEISRKTLTIVKQNIVFAIGVKLLVLILAAVGAATMWAAVFADVGVAVIAILNAMRAMKIK